MHSRCFPKPAVSAIITQDGRVLLVRRGCEPNKDLWSLPGGSIEPGETAREAVAREVREETSLEVEVGGVAGVRDVIAREGGAIAFHYVIISFFARVISGEPQAGSDAAEVRWTEPEDIKEMPTTPGLIEHLAEAGVS